MTIFRIAAVATLAAALTAPASVVPAAEAAGPVDRNEPAPSPAVEATRSARDFYGWYLKELRADREPLRTPGDALANRVARPLLRELRERVESPGGLEADYFLQAQDFAEDWVDRIRVGDAHVQGGTATVSVDLGGDPRLLRKLRVTLVTENTRWKIRRVTAR